MCGTWLVPPSFFRLEEPSDLFGQDAGLQGVVEFFACAGYVLSKDVLVP